ncbi:type II secretion system protein N [Croceicoccus naphthovorans]|uniref:Type II secretion system protein N n=1 Tax=Croceicoccus naphthovorans TaxID=1348774 RepID=A0A0G3XJ83_9SPHN|nr:type II secretion system protein N [Croceicoccus naphthovorans]AKM10659.1 hypothetical protein AB433_12890 [Croceicoccus naphthovorans]MBB3988893.1 general secretion pathway protein N [Croceicoccus naphthovorans]
MIGRWIFIRDGRLSRTTKAVLVLLVLIALVGLLPLRLVLGAANGSGSLSASEVAGTAWDGAAGDFTAGGLPLGSLYVALRPLPLLLGRTEFSLNRPAMPGQPEFHAAARGGEGWVLLKEANGQIDLAGLMAPLPVRALSFADFQVEMNEGACVSASGQLGLIVPSLGPALPGDTILSGPASCEDGALVVPMVGPTGTEKLNLTLRPDSTWQADLMLAGLPVEVAGPLIEMGFTEKPGGLGFSARGTL